MTTTELATQQTYRVTDLKAMAEIVASSGMFPALKTPQQAFTLMLLCEADGMHAAHALRRYHVMQDGRPAMKAETMLAEFLARGGQITYVQRDAQACEALFTAPGVSGEVRVRWDMAKAKRAQCRIAMYEKFPEAMFTARTVSEGVRAVMPGVTSGIYTPEEMADLGPSNQTSRVQPEIVDVQIDDVISRPPAPKEDHAPKAPNPTGNQTGMTPDTSTKSEVVDVVPAEAVASEAPHDPGNDGLRAAVAMVKDKFPGTVELPPETTELKQALFEMRELVKKLGWESKRAREWIKVQFGVASSTHMSLEQALQARERLVGMLADRPGADK